MPVPLVRNAIWAIAAAVAVVLIVVGSLPLVASTRIVQSRIAQELSARTGYRVSLGEAPSLTFWPSLKAVLSDVSFSRWEDNNQPAVLVAERLHADLSAWQALLGRIEISTVTLQRPVLRVERADGELHLPALPRGGRLLDILNAGEAQPPRKSPALGTVRFQQGRIVEAGSGRDIATDLSGMAEWESSNAAALLNGRGIWRGEAIRYALLVESPLKLASGAGSKVNASFESDPFRASFTGLVSRADGFAFDGALEASSPSVRRALEWSEAEIGPGASMGALALSGKATGGIDRLKLADAKLSLNDNPGVGALEMAFAGPVPRIAGTLAFETLDIGQFLAAFAVPPGRGPERPVFDLAFTDQFNLDLRVSATKASGSGIQLSDVAATAQVKSGFAAFDISDATALGGEIQAGFRVDRRPEGEIGEMRISATGLDFALLAERIGWTRNLPQATGSLNVVLKSPMTDVASLPRTIEGMVSGKLGPGSLKDLELARLRGYRPGSGFFPLSEVGGAALSIEGAEFKATLGKGVARIETARAWNARDLVMLEGIIPYVGRSLALSLAVDKRAKPNAPPDPAEAMNYFIGGSWDAPYVTAVLSGPEP
jgi:AsmA protein